MAEIKQEPVQVVQDPADMNIIQLRQFAKSKGHANVGRMKKTDLLALLNGTPPVVEEKAPVQSKVSEDVVKQFVETGEHLQQKNKTPGVNIVKMRANVKGLVAKCENPELLLRIAAMLN